LIIAFLPAKPRGVFSSDNSPGIYFKK